MTGKKNFLVAVLLAAFIIADFVSASPAKNVIFFIGDGMGFEQVNAAGMYANGEPNTLCFESFPHKAKVNTYSADSAVTDSAAAGTSIATGRKVNNGVVSMAYPGNGSEIQTVLEYLKAKGKTTGIVTTADISDATPAAFGAHEPSRSNYLQITGDYLNQTSPDILFGGAGYITPAAASAAGYVVVTDRYSMQAVDANTAGCISGQFGGGNMPYEYDGLGLLPHLSEMTSAALDILDNGPNGFFLLVEGGLIDKAEHNKDIRRSVRETIEFADAVQRAIDWAAGRTDTLIVVTADHETGGLSVTANNGKGQFPTVTWGTGGHTAADVPVYAQGVNAELISGILDNTDFFAIATISEVGYPDYDADGDTDFADFAFFGLQWGRTGCVFPYYCSGADLDLCGGVDFGDLSVFASLWLKK